MSSKQFKIAIIDYKMGNIGSIVNMLKYIGVDYDIASAPKDLSGISAIILPGVGHFGRAMQNLSSNGMDVALKNQITNFNIPILGICLGMQLLCNSSEEGSELGLGLINADVRKIIPKHEANLKVPHMCWNHVVVKRDNVILPASVGIPAKFYFVHSYFVDCYDSDDIIGITQYGFNFVSAFQRNNIVGVQFHPEKSHTYGIKLFRNFIKLAS